METAQRTARDVMTAEVITVQVDDTVAEAARLLLDAGITGAPVIDRWGNAVGVFTLTDVVYCTSEEERRRDDESFYRMDLRTHVSTPLSLQEPLADLKVGDCMTPRVHTVPDSASVATVTHYLLDKGIHRVFVRDGDNRLVGVITSVDLLRVLADLLTAEARRAG